MLKTRVITAIVMLVLFLWLLIAAQPDLFGWFLMLVIALAAWEWSRLAIKPSISQWLFIVAIVAITYLVWQLSPEWILTFSAIWLASPWLSRTLVRSEGHFTLPILLGLALLPLTFHAVFQLRFNLSPDAHWQLLLGCLLVVWCADSFAYFSGKTFGKHKLAPSISPGKTWEGVYGALVGVAIVQSVYWMVMTGPKPHYVAWVLICLITAAFSVLGDLLESGLKRGAGVKDSSALIPGHGGILDRVDGVLAAAPIFASLIVLEAWFAHGN